jgi:hypothetical protein
MTITHEEISKRAREIWEREGRPEGRDKEHWLQAEAELRQQPTQPGGAMNSEDSRIMNEPAPLGKENGSAKRSAGRRGK